MAAVSLTGCVKKAGSRESGGEGAAEEDVLNVYTALEDEQITEYLKEFKEKYPDVTVNITRDSTGVITSKTAGGERQSGGRCRLGALCYESSGSCAE